MFVYWHSLYTCQVLILSESKQEYTEMLHHNFAQCVCTGHTSVEHSPSIYNIMNSYLETVLLIYQEGQDKLWIAFTSCLLAPAKKNYFQIDKEALTIVFRVKHFHQYRFRPLFTIIKSYHKPLQFLLGEKKGISSMA